ILSNVHVYTSIEGTVIKTNNTRLSIHFIPESSNIRWLEFDEGVKFISTDPASPDFLTPDWNDSLVQKYIVDQGWPECGVKDVDGSIADIGAVSKTGERPIDIVTIRPTRAMWYQPENKSLNLSFSITPRIGEMFSPKMIYLRLIKNIDKMIIGGFGKDSPILPQENIQTITLPETLPLQMGINEYTISIEDSISKYSFIEMIVEGEGTKGNKFTSSVGFLPLRRKHNYYLNIELRDKEKDIKIDEVKVGIPVILYIEALEVTENGTQKFLKKIDSVDVSLFSEHHLTDTNDNPLKEFSIIEGSSKIEVIFPAVPHQNGGIEYICVSGKSDSIPFVGCSEKIKIYSSEESRLREEKLFEGINKEALTFEKERLILKTQKLSDFTLYVYGLNGKLLSRVNQKVEPGLYSASISSLLPTTLPKGVYLVTVKFDRNKISNKVVYRGGQGRFKFSKAGI
ncbi:MAG: T9SS type A sorting domain-containing protein, partial [Chitinispirillaceae bacterium]|nr:T9SS type A sorting domain-containing protein [Chitinispirillaceae bacterium]